MKELIIISGKGGTGKTSLIAAFAALAEDKVLCDADVDAADLHLILDPEVRERHEFTSGNTAVIDPQRCTECGTCRDMCRFDASSANSRLESADNSSSDRSLVTCTPTKLRSSTHDVRSLAIDCV